MFMVFILHVKRFKCDENGKNKKKTYAQFKRGQQLQQLRAKAFWILTTV